MAAAGRCLALSRRRSHERHVTDWVRAASPQAVPPRTTWLAGPVWDSARDLQNSLPAGRTTQLRGCCITLARRNPVRSDHVRAGFFLV